jgi:hypothetical protein
MYPKLAKQNFLLFDSFNVSFSTNRMILATSEIDFFALEFTFKED